MFVELTVICEYLDDVFHDRPLKPKSASGRARTRYWTKAVDVRVLRVASARGSPARRERIMKNFGAIVLALIVGQFSILSAWGGSGAGSVNDVTGTGLSGYDAVSYFEANGPKQGIPKYSTVQDGVLYLFASAEHCDASPRIQIASCRDLAVIVR